MKSAPAIAFEYRPSRWLAAALVCIALLALLAVGASAVPLWLQLLLGAVVCVWAAYSVQRVLRPVVQRCAWHESGHWRLRDRAGEDHAASLLRASVRGALIVLVLRSALQRTTALVLLPDNSDSDTRRRLRLRLARASVDVP